jgi:hypothetical protein
VIAVVAIVLTAIGAGAAEPSRFISSAACKANYDYAGVQQKGQRAGIRAYVTTVKAPKVIVGHVAGWLGVGGPGLGPNGTDEWMQIGYAGFDTGKSQIYYEDALPGKPPRYHTLKENLGKSEKHRLAILEVGTTTNSWRVWLDDKAVSPATVLPNSNGRFAPQALAENWNGSTTKNCNSYGYGFNGIQVSTKPGGSWTAATAGYVWKNAHQLIQKTSSDSFNARSTASARATAPDEPPLLGRLASRLLGKKVTARCARQTAPAREHPASVLLLSDDVCEILVGYAVAEPWAPRPDSAAGLAVATTALGFLRWVASASPRRAPYRDCRAVGLFERTMRTLGATGQQARALRGALLYARTSIHPALELGPSCPIR